MAFVQQNLFKNIAIFGYRRISRSLSKKQFEKSVFISQSKDVYTNMALEEWISKNYDLKNHNVMLFYMNQPCILIGKNDNPWLDTNILSGSEVKNSTVALARRVGTGNAAYQDMCTSNFTFFTENDTFDKNYNFSILKRGIFRKYGTKLDQAEDKLTAYDIPVCNSGITVGNRNSYHSCSLYINVNKSNFNHVFLNKQEEHNVAQKSLVLNLLELQSNVSSDGILSAIGWEYLRTPACKVQDDGIAFANKQRGFQMINPTEQWFPGITEIRDKLSNWEWCYGKTPRYEISHSFLIPAHLLNNRSEIPQELRIKIVVDHGRINDIVMCVPPGILPNDLTGKVMSELKGQKFSEQATEAIQNILNVLRKTEKDNFAYECVKHAMRSAAI